MLISLLISHAITRTKYNPLKPTSEGLEALPYYKSQEAAIYSKEDETRCITNNLVLLISGPEGPPQDQAEPVKLYNEYGDEMRVKDLRLDGVHAIIRAFFQKRPNITFASVGNGEANITTEMIEDKLHDMVNYIKIYPDCSVSIIVKAHGRIFSVGETNAHAIDLNCTPGETQALYTARLLTTFHQILQKPIDVILVSCNPGPSIKYVHLLPEGSKLLAFRTDEKPMTKGSAISPFHYMDKAGIQGFSLPVLLQAYFLSGRCDGSDSLPHVAISGYKKEANTFMDFVKSSLGKKFSIESLQLIFQELSGFKLPTKIGGLFGENIQVPRGLVDSMVKECVKAWKDYKKGIKDADPYTNEIILSGKLSSQEIQEIESDLKGLTPIIRQYSEIDLAIGLIEGAAAGKNLPEVFKKYPSSYGGGEYGRAKKDGIQLDSPVGQALAVLTIAYSGQQNIAIQDQDIAPVREEILGLRAGEMVTQEFLDCLGQHFPAGDADE